MPNDDNVVPFRRGEASPRTGGPVMAAYADTGAIDRDCPNCTALAGEFCVHDGFQGRVERKVPCLARTLSTTEAQKLGKRAGR